jgi:Protein of unknown function (DUF2891)
MGLGSAHRRRGMRASGTVIAALIGASAASVGGQRADAEDAFAALSAARASVAAQLVRPIQHCVARRDTDHDAFHGCVDWHSAVHGTWALVAYAGMTGDNRYEPLVDDTLQPGRVAAERALLRASSDFEMPYGRAWFLRLAREHQVRHRSGTLKPMADEVLASLMAYYRGRRPNPRTGSYRSDSWALINMHDYAAWSGNGTALETIRGWVHANFVRHDGGCDYGLEAGHFMAVCTNWAWLVSKVLGPDQFDRWADAFFEGPGLPRPVAQPYNWHHHGLNFSRAWGLWGLHAAGGSAARKKAYLDAYVAHFRATYDKPAHWRGSYEGVAHWVPQFGMLALQPLFGVAR